MGEQLELFDGRINKKRLKWEEALHLLWEYHLKYLDWHKSARSCIKAILEFFRGQYIDDCTRFDYENYRRWRSSQMYRGRTISPTTVNKDHTIMNLVFNKLEEWREVGHIGNYYLSHLMLPRIHPGKGVRKAKEFPREVVLDRDEMIMLRELAFDDLPMQKLLYMKWMTKLRMSDLRQLQKSKHVIPYLNEIHKVQSKTISSRCPSGILVKIPITRMMRDFLDENLNDFVFPHRPYWVNWRRRWDRLMARWVQAGKKRFWFDNDIRRSSACHDLDSGDDIVTVQNNLGHSDIRTTIRYTPRKMTHLQKSARKREVAIFGKLEYSAIPDDWRSRFAKC